MSKYNKLLDQEKLVDIIKYNNKINLIYLDFDGVIFTINKPIFKINNVCVKLLSDFIKRTPNTYIILTTSHRYNELIDTIESLKDPLFDKLKPYILGQTERTTHRIRGQEIYEINTQLRLKQIKFNYVILDDDSDMLYIQRNNFIKTHTFYGLCENDMHRMERIFDDNKTQFHIILCTQKHDKIHYKFEHINIIYGENDELVNAIKLPIFDESSDGTITIKSHNESIKVFQLLSEILINYDEFEHVFDMNYNVNMTKFKQIFDDNLLLEDSLYHYLSMIKTNNLTII